MQLMDKIRSRAGLLIGLIGGAMFLFILGDILQSNGSMFGMGNRRPEFIGQINEDRVGPDEFNRIYDAAESNHKQQYKTNNVDEATRLQLQEQVWGQVLRERLLNQQTAAIGMGLSDAEIQDMLTGNEPHPQIRQFFTSPQTGQFDRNAVIQSLKAADQDKTGEAKKNWAILEEYILLDRKTTKYLTALKKGEYMPSALAKMDFSEKNDKAFGQMVYQDYNMIADSAVKLSEADIKAYYESHKEEYRQKEGRSLEYVMWSIMPSSLDSAEARQDIDKLVGEFRTTTDDSTFLVANSDAAYSEQYRKKDELGTVFADSLTRAPVGTVLGPAFEGEQIRYYKKLGSAMRADSIRASHILLQPKSGEKMADAMKRADSLKAVVMAGGDFASLARTMSKDSASAVKGGDLGTFPYEMMIPAFSKEAFATPAGQYVTVETRFGAHLIRVDENKMDQQKYLVGIYGKNFDVSKESIDEVFGKAGTFSSKNRTATQFTKAIEAEKMLKREAQNFKESDRTIPGFSNARDLIRWAYEVEPGAVSAPITLDQDKIVVALLIEAHEDGISPLASVRKRVEVEALKSKKGDILVASMKKKAAGLKSVAEIGTKLNLPVMPLQDVSFGGGYIPGLGREPKVLGALFGMAKGKVSAPIKGDRGVYILQLERIDAAPVPEDIKPYSQQMAMQYTMQLDNQALQALQEASDIVDNRYLFF